MGKAMTARERVLLAISHNEPDRVPIDYISLIMEVDDEYFSEYPRHWRDYR